MKTLLLLALLIAMSVWTQAETDPESSPDGKYSIENISPNDEGRYFEIRSKSGDVVYSSRGKEIISQAWIDDGWGAHDLWEVQNVRWSSDSKLALLSVTWYRWQSVCIFSVSEKSLECIDAKEYQANTAPVRWVNPQTFVIEVSGPHGTHARDAFWHYRKTYRVSINPLSLECVYTGTKKTEPLDADFN